MNRIFITGMGRSGTTLLDKLLSNHQDIEVLSQPFPMLFTELKKEFLNSIGEQKYYVLNDNAFNNDYDLSDFNLFLDTYKFSYQHLKQIFEAMQNYSGQMTKVSFDLTPNKSYSFIDLFDSILKSNCIKKDINFFGAKEIMCEEFIPYLSQKNTKIILIIRDPRDVVASVNYPKGEKYLGSKKPTLFVLQGWRRTIDYIKNIQNNENIIFIKYENLVTTPYLELNKIAEFLGVNKFSEDSFDNGICDRDGNLWKANTSFETKTSFISSKSVGGYKNVLSSDEVNYIESICKDEMKFMGYAFDSKPNSKIIKEFKDYGVEDSNNLDKNFSSSKENIESELKIFS